MNKTRLKNLPKTIKVWKDREEQELELHLKNVVMYDFKLGNLLFNAIKAEKKYTQTLDDMKYNIPF